MTTTDEARVTDEEIAEQVRRCALSHKPDVRLIGNVRAADIVTLADRLAARDAEVAKLRAERDMFEKHAHEGWALANHRTRQWKAAEGERDSLRAERDEMVSLLEELESDRWFGTPVDTVTRGRAMLAKLRGAPADQAPSAPPERLVEVHKPTCEVRLGWSTECDCDADVAGPSGGEGRR